MLSSPIDEVFVRNIALHAYKRYAVRFCDPEPFPPKTESPSTTDGGDNGKTRSRIDHHRSWRGYLTQLKVPDTDTQSD